MTINSLGSSTALLGGLVQQLEKTSRAETTVSTPDGGSITTVGTGKNSNIVSVTSPGGETITEVGYVSPVLLQGFLDSLFQSLQSDGLGGGTPTLGTIGKTSQPAPAGIASSDPAQAPDAASALSSSLQTLIQQLGPNEPSTPMTSQLLASFEDLMQGSGIAMSSDSQDAAAATPQAAKAALQAFLSNAMPLQGGSDKTAGSSVDATA
jgi:hypothetical protein